MDYVQSLLIKPLLYEALIHVRIFLPTHLQRLKKTGGVSISIYKLLLIIARHPIKESWILSTGHVLTMSTK